MRTIPRRLAALLLCLVLSVSLAACGAEVPSATLPASTPPVTDTPQSLPPSQTPQTPAVTDTPQPTSDPSPEVSNSEPPSPEVTPTAVPTEPVEPTNPPVETSPVPEIPLYQFGTPLEETEKVEDTHFDTAVFLGDSRTEGLQLFGGIRHGDYYWARGMTVFRVDDPKSAIFEIDGEKYTMIGALRQKQYESVYIMVGVNELGYSAVSYEEGLGKFIDLVLEVQPNAVIYLQILPPVNDEVAQKNGLASYINNANINRFNEAIVRVAALKKVVLLDTAEVYRDENGSLPAEMATDGCHFIFSGYAPWANYLRTHVMDPEVYHMSRAAEVEPEPDSSPEPSDEPAATEEPMITDPPETETEQEAPQQ